MSDFQKYISLERYGTAEVAGINLGVCHIFPKIDGTNSSVWYDPETGDVFAGSRNRKLSLEKDNGGFYQWVLHTDQKNLRDFVKQNPHLIVYGEFLIPHSFKGYRDDAWRKLYVFDIYDRETENFLSYDVYQPMLEESGIEYLAPLKVMNNPDLENLYKTLEQNKYLVKDEEERAGEGIVIKRYNYINKYGRTTWAKMVTSAFKEDNAKTFGGSILEGKNMVEQEIVDKYLTKEICDKVYHKIEVSENGFLSKHIPRYLETSFYDLVREETYSFIKDNNFPTINFKDLKHLSYEKAKEFRPEIFGK